MPVFIKKRPAVPPPPPPAKTSEEDLEAVGLAPAPVQQHHGARKIVINPPKIQPPKIQPPSVTPSPRSAPKVIPTFEMGQRVTITAINKSDVPSWKNGDSGRIKRLCKASGMHDVRPDDDMYFVDLDKVRVSGKPVAYLKFSELRPFSGN